MEGGDMALVEAVDFREEFDQCRPMRLYVFRRPNTMDPDTHTFSDDVAITYAASRKWAIRHFAQLYADVTKDEVFEVRFNADGVAILTDY